MERRLLDLIFYVWKITFPRFNLNDILEREWWLMHNLNLGYQDIQTMPWEFIEWFYNKHVQYLVDKQKASQEQRGHFI